MLTFSGWKSARSRDRAPVAAYTANTMASAIKRLV
jgi:hypothetical protein